MKLNTNFAAGNSYACSGRVHVSVPGNCTLKHFRKSADNCRAGIAGAENRGEMLAVSQPEESTEDM